jgi:hypothetical protein
MRRICDTESCCAYIGNMGFVPGFVDIHIADQSHCTFLPNGEPVVDYIGVSENLSQDWGNIVAEINDRAGTDFAAQDPSNPNGVGGSSSGGVEHACTSEKVLQFMNDSTSRDSMRLMW